MTRSIARRVVGSAVGVLAGALLLVGAATATGVHLQQVEAADRDLLVAAHARALSEGGRHAGIEAWISEEGDPRVPERLRARAAAGERIFKDKGDQRMLLLPIRLGDGRPGVVAAITPRVTVLRSVGPFAAIWLAASGIGLGLSAAALSGAVRLAFRPLDRARQEVARVVALGQGQRVSTSAPDEIRPLLEAVDALLDRLDSAHSLQVRFTAEAAHELRTPVASLLGELDVALRRDRSAEVRREVLVSVREDVERLRRLVEALTVLSRVDSGEIEAHREPVRASEIAQSALDRELSILAEAGCRLVLHLDDDPELEAHRTLLELALGNLLRNAARHAPGSEVTLTARCEADRAVFEVRDTGPGIPEELGEASFDRFARGAAARVADPTGLGLGLPLAREVARRHGGDCVLKPVPSGGTRAVLSVACGGPLRAT